MSDNKWELARALYLQSLPYKDIVEQVNATVPPAERISRGALKKRVLREGWKMGRTQALEIVKGQGLKLKSDFLRVAVVDECLKDVHVVSQNDPKNMSQSERRQKLISTIATNGEKAGGWSSGNAHDGMMVRIENLSACYLADPIPNADGSVNINGKRHEIEDYVEFDANGNPIKYTPEEYFAKYPEKRPLPVIDVPVQSESSGNGHINGDNPQPDAA